MAWDVVREVAWEGHLESPFHEEILEIQPFVDSDKSGELVCSPTTQIAK